MADKDKKDAEKRKRRRKNRKVKEVVKEQLATTAASLEKADSSLPGRKYPEAIKEAARYTYLVTDATIAQVAHALGIPKGTVDTWSSREGWVGLRKQVRKLALQEAIRQSRRAVSRHYRDLNSYIDEIVARLRSKLESSDLEGMTREKDVIQLLLRAIDTKLSMLGALDRASLGKEFAPDPDSFAETPVALPFDSVDPKKIAQLLSGNEVRAAIGKIVGSLSDPKMAEMAVNALYELAGVDPDNLKDVKERAGAAFAFLEDETVDSDE